MLRALRIGPRRLGKRRVVDRDEARLGTFDLLDEGDVGLAQADLRSGRRDVLHLGRDHLVVADLAAGQRVGGLLARRWCVVGEGVGVGAGDSARSELVVSGSESGRLSAQPRRRCHQRPRRRPTRQQ